jgi:hypothetical protein
VAAILRAIPESQRQLPGSSNQAYGGDISRAMRDGDQKVAAVVTAWEKLLPDDGRLIQAPSQA